MTEIIKRSALRRFKHRARTAPQFVRGVSADNPMLDEARTRYPATVYPVTGEDRVLKSGHNSAKIGKIVTKGRWVGMPIYMLTLEERATCPATCRHWSTCYGNQMHWAWRFEHGDALETQIERELTGLQLRHPKGFVVRLHQLGDFYSVDYVNCWLAWLHMFPALNVYGYTAWQRGTPIGATVRLVRNLMWKRFAVRTSDADGRATTRTIDFEPNAPRVNDAVVCPEQTGKTDCCATCGLCWAGEKRPAVDQIAFILH